MSCKGSFSNKYLTNQQRISQCGGTKKTGNNGQIANSEYGAFNYTTISEYKFGRQIGQGAYAVVKECYHKITGKTLAIKVYDKYKLLDI